jgi:hypothetical protein
MTNTSQYRRIRSLMFEHDVTCVKIARQEQVSDTYVTFVVTGRRTGYRIRRAIAAACSVPVEQLWPDTPLEYRQAA